MGKEEFIPAERDPLKQQVEELVERAMIDQSYAISTHINHVQEQLLTLSATIQKQNKVLRVLFERLKKVEEKTK